MAHGMVLGPCFSVDQCPLFLCTYVPSHSPTLCDLAHVCAEVCCACGPQINQELMGAFRALCLPVTMKSCQTGFSHLSYKTNVWHQFLTSPFFVFSVQRTHRVCSNTTRSSPECLIPSQNCSSRSSSYQSSQLVRQR